MPIPALDGDYLPAGRHWCTPKEVEGAFVSAEPYAGSISRTALWQHWEQAVALLTGAVTVYAAWLGGSFVSSKRNPRDIDAAFIISEEDRASRGPAERQMIEAFNIRVPDPITGKLVPPHGLLIDSFIIPWKPYHGPRTDQYNYYVGERGYWDDMWSRRRMSSKGAKPVREDAFPVRGYLEVNLSDYI